MPIQYRSLVVRHPGTTIVQSGRILVVPFWLLLIATGAWPAWHFSAGFRRRYQLHPFGNPSLNT
jgi:hypothetical protein